MPSLTVNPDGSLHIHSYIRGRRAVSPTVTRKDPQLYVCSDPLCTHKMRRESLYGKLSLCPGCLRNTLILNSQNLKLSRPRCLDCSNTKEAKARRAIQAGLGEIFGADI